MAKAKQVRWECPNGKHRAVLGSTRPLKLATVRYCLPCSEEAGVLVERVAPALERKRAAKTVVRQSKAERERIRQRQAREEARLVTVLDRAGREVRLDVEELLRDAWRTDELREQQRKWWRGPGYPVPPKLTIRRGQKTPAMMWARHTEETKRKRARDSISGYARHGGRAITLTIGPGTGEEWLRAIVVHEAAHSATPDGTAHGSLWRSAYLRTVRELYPDAELPVLDGQPRYELDEQFAEAILRTLEER